MVRPLALVAAFVVAATLGAAQLGAAKEMPVPAQCTPEINAVLADLVADRGQTEAYNVMVCGIVTEATTFGSPNQPRPNHHQTIVAAPTANGPLLIKIVTNDRRDGIVLAKKGDHVEAFGWFHRPAAWEHEDVGQIDNTFCAIHGDLYNGWVVVNGIRWPRAGCGAGSSLP